MSLLYYLQSILQVLTLLKGDQVLLFFATSDAHVQSHSYHLGLLKAKLAKLRRELLAPSGGGGGGGAGVGFDVARTGALSPLGSLPSSFLPCVGQVLLQWDLWGKSFTRPRTSHSQSKDFLLWERFVYVPHTNAPP